MKNSVLDAIDARRSVRAYKREALDQEQIASLVQAGLAAPSAMNRQPWHFIVVQNQEILLTMEKEITQHFVDVQDTMVIERLKERDNKIFYDAPLVIFLAVNQKNLPSLDAGIAVQNIALAAQSMGLGSVILGFPGLIFQGPKGDYWRKRLAFPEGTDFAIAIAIGYGEGEGAPHELDLSKVVYVD